jgi:hypothetical protein
MLHIAACNVFVACWIGHPTNGAVLQYGPTVIEQQIEKERGIIKWTLYLSWFIRSSSFLTKFAVVKTDLILFVRSWYETLKVSPQWGGYIYR